MNTARALITLGFGLAALTGRGAEPAPKLVPRPLPGFAAQAPAALPVPVPVAFSKPESPAAPLTNTAPFVDPESEKRARIVFIHRRATLPPELTKDLAKPGIPGDKPRTSAAQANIAQPGKIRIIPKAEVASLLTAPAESKPLEP